VHRPIYRGAARNILNEVPPTRFGTSPAAGRVRIAVSGADIDDVQRHDLIGLAAVDDEAHGLLGDQRAVRLALGVERVAAGAARRGARFGGAAACEVED